MSAIFVLWLGRRGPENRKNLPSRPRRSCFWALALGTSDLVPSGPNEGLGACFLTLFVLVYC